MSADGSESQRLRESLQRVTRELSRTRTILTEIATQYNPTVTEVVATVGGSAQRIDQDMTETMTGARAKTNSAIDLIRQVEGRVNSYANQRL